MKNRRRNKDDIDTENIYAEDPGKLDMIGNLTSTRLLEISERFDMYPAGYVGGSGRVDCHQFVKLMKEVMQKAGTALGNSPDFPEKLVDLFYRASKNAELPMIEFSDLTSFLIEHEITQQKSAMANADMKYEESLLKDKRSHNNHIERIYYFERIDKVILYEQNVKTFKVYSGSDLTWIQDIECQSNILAIEFCDLPDLKVIAVSLADRTIAFFEQSALTQQKEKSSKKGKGQQKPTIAKVMLKVPST